MSKRKDDNRPAPPAKDTQHVPPPVDVVDGIPDRQARPAKWKYVLLAVVFLAWVAFLVYCQIAGKP
jgi:hypothetical protein